MDRSLKLFVACLTVLAPSAALYAAGVGPNLIINGGAEDSPGAGNFSVTLVPAGWTTTSALTAVQYFTSNGVLSTDDSAAINGGLNYFAGGPNTASSTASQTLNVSTLQPQLPGGQRWFRLGGHLGGFDTQADRATFAVTIGSDTIGIGPVTVADRQGDTKLMWRYAFGTLPAGATTANFVLTATRVDGSYNDGYADNLAFQMTAEPGDASLNRQVNFDDLLILAQNYGQSNRAWETGDFTGDGAVGFDDLLLLAQHYGSTGSTSLPGDVGESFHSDWTRARSLVPEPALLSGLIPLGLIRRRR